ncbi:sulfatase family protein [Arundinibacter roseus]|uniref:Sulfatase n=1 Tax=Arundinibacter roseus TaxID=2070510 RepID=A0A4V2XAG5_9BACT|nr:sulfatase [Arundinibacter roseus]TDB67455.1 sulfatase [Arundinibacter roseus]
MKKHCLVYLLLMTLCVSGYAQPKPNILWITIEDTSPQFVGCYGNADARTPVIDQMAREGIRFTNAFSTGTVCSPSRSTLVTGVRTFEAGTGNHRSNYPLPSRIHGFPYYMQQQGYYTCNNSKTDYNVANPAEFTKNAWNESSGKAGWWDRKPGQPFFAVFNYNDSHQSRTMTDPYEKYVETVLNELPLQDRIAENAFAMPPFYRDSPEMRKQFARVYNSIKLTDNKIGQLLRRLEKDKLRDSTIIFFFADHGEGIPRGKTNGINLGYRVPFVIWFPPMYKHLSPWGEGGQVSNELIDFEDLAPTLIRLTGGSLPDHLKGRVLLGPHRSPLVNHLVLSSDRSDNGIDMSRTVTDGRYLYTRNYMPYMPEARYIRYMEIGDIKQHMRQDLSNNQLNSLQAGLFAPRQAEVLYDLENDLWETRNLIDDPAFARLATRMRNQLDQSLIKRNDVLFLPEYEIARLSKSTTPYEFRLNSKKYPIKEIYAAASLSGHRSAAVLKKQVQLLKNANPVVRYWAAVGLRSQTKDHLHTYKQELIRARNESYQPAEIILAALLYESFQDNIAVETLKHYCVSDNMELALMAVNELLYVRDKGPFVETIKSRHQVLAATPGGALATSYKVKAACMDFLGSLGLVPNTPAFSE